MAKKTQLINCMEYSLRSENSSLVFYHRLCAPNVCALLCLAYSCSFHRMKYIVEMQRNDNSSCVLLFPSSLLFPWCPRRVCYYTMCVSFAGACIGRIIENTSKMVIFVVLPGEPSSLSRLLCAKRMAKKYEILWLHTRLYVKPHKMLHSMKRNRQNGVDLSQ